MISGRTAAAAGFLRHALARGALDISELEVKARAEGLLGQHQQIQHAKAFKKAKKALGIQSIRNGFGSGGKWAWSIPLQAAQIAIVTIANLNPDPKEQLFVRDAKLPDEEPPSARDAKLPDRTPAEWESGGIVQQWIEGVQRLNYVRCPTAVPLIR
jgi:hypothetical protein